jgi:predicted lipase
MISSHMRTFDINLAKDSVYDSRHLSSAVINAVYIERTPEGYDNSSIAMQTPKVPDSNLRRITVYPGYQ